MTNRYSNAACAPLVEQLKAEINRLRADLDVRNQHADLRRDYS